MPESGHLKVAAVTVTAFAVGFLSGHYKDRANYTPALADPTVSVGGTEDRHTARPEITATTESDRFLFETGSHDSKNNSYSMSPGSLTLSAASWPVLKTSQVQAKADTTGIYAVTAADYADAQRRVSLPDVTQVVITVDEAEANDLDALFEEEETVSDWGQAYQDRIVQYMDANDRDGNVAVDSMMCKTTYCRLDVSILDSGKFLELYREMSQQDWWDTTAFWNAETEGQWRTLILQRMSADLDTESAFIGDYEDKDGSFL